MEIFKISKTDSVASIVFILLFSFALIFCNFNFYLFIPPVYAIILINLILAFLFIYAVYRFHHVFFDEFIVNQDEIIQIKYNKTTISIKWRDITKMTYNYGNVYIYLYGDNKKICIYIRISNVETLIIFVRDHLDNELTKKALYNLEASTFVCLK